MLHNLLYENVRKMLALTHQDEMLHYITAHPASKNKIVTAFRHKSNRPRFPHKYCLLMNVASCEHLLAIIHIFTLHQRYYKPR